MIRSSRSLLAAVAAAAALFATCAQAAPLLTFGGQTAGDLSGLTSNFVPAANNPTPASNYYIETFDFATRTVGLPLGTTAPNPGAGISIQQSLPSGVPTGCAINSFNTIGVSVAAGSFEVVKGTYPNQAEAPKNDQTCYGVAPARGGTAPAAVIIDYTSLLASLGANVGISYLGLYYGSIDSYNDLYFYDSLAAANADTSNTGVGSIGFVSGADVAGAASGSPTDDQANQYVNLAFDLDESFKVFKFVSTGIAVEVDNIVVGTTLRDVPEPASLALLGAGLAALGLSRRRKAAK